MTTFVIVHFMKIKSYAGLPSQSQSTTETEINSFCAGQKTLLNDMVMCILAWTKGCGYWLGLCPRQGQEVQRGSPCPVMEALSWSSGSLRAGRVSWGLEIAPGLPPWETTRGHKGLLQWLKLIFFEWLWSHQSSPAPVMSSWFSVGFWAHNWLAAPESGWWSLHPRGRSHAGPLNNCLSLCRGRQKVCSYAFYPLEMWALRMESAQSSLWYRSHLPPPPRGNHSLKRGWAILGKRGWRQG